jgi:hypothetical protein
MNRKSCALLSLAVLVMLAVPFQSGSDASDTPVGYYESQLDDVGKSVYGQVLDAMMADATADSVDVSATIGSDLVFRASDSAAAMSAADAYCSDVISKVLTALYLDDPSLIWLWDYPVTSIELSFMHEEVEIFQSTDSAYAPGTVGFTLSVSQDYAGKVAETRDALLAAAQAFPDAATMQKTVRSIHDRIYAIKSVDDAEGTVSNAYDALVTKESSSIGKAAAFTYVCKVKSIDAVTLAGTAYKSSGSAEGSVAFWNAVASDGSWYLVDCTLKDCVLLGTTGTAGGVMSSIRVASTGVMGLDVPGYPELSRLSYEFPDERGFLEKYGPHVMIGLIGVLISAAVVMAVRQGNA